VGEATIAFERAEARAPGLVVSQSPDRIASATHTECSRSASHCDDVPQRRGDIASLRILLCAGIILFHVLSIFAAEPIYHLKSAVVSPTASVLAEFLRIAIVPLFFVLAGWSAVASLRRRSVGGFVRERVKRLVVPLCVGGALFGSVIKYIELSNGRDIGFHGFRLTESLQGGFFEFFPRNLSRMNQLTWSHLWFLAYLFLISLLLLPWLTRLSRLAPQIAVPAAPIVYLPALAIAALLAGFDGYWPYLPNLYTDWTNFSYFALCVAFGAGIAAWPGFETRLHSETPRLLLLMLLSYGGVVLCGVSTAGRVFVGLTAWGAVGVALGIAGRIKLPPTPALAYLGEAMLPVFVLHEVPVLMLGVAVLPLDLPVGLKIAMIWLSATAVTVAAYHWLVRPWPLMRWTMGMDARPRAGSTGAA
jgi:glucans biosynthesis protein C